MEAAVVLEGGAYVEAVAAAEVPGAAGVDRVVDEDPATGWAEGGGVEVEGTVEIFPGRD